MFFFLSPNYFTPTPVIGFFNIFLYLIFWYTVFNNQKDNHHFFEDIVNIFIIYGAIMAVGAYIQFYISPDIFGLTHHAVYSRDLTGSPQINKRAISFISSPQTLALYLAVALILALNIKKKSYKFFMLIVIAPAGILTFSKVFILVLFSYLLFYLLANINLRNIIFLFSLIIIFAVTAVLFSEENRAFEIFHILANIKDHVTFQVWMDYLSYQTNFMQFLFGHGIGLVSRAAQSIGGYAILNGSVESFLLQLYFEIGFIGILIFTVFYLKSVLNYLRSKAYRNYGLMLFSFSVAILGTPAFYGFTSSLLLSFFIIFGYFINLECSDEN
jgi:hypothetical protein